MAVIFVAVMDELPQLRAFVQFCYLSFVIVGHVAADDGMSGGCGFVELAHGIDFGMVPGPLHVHF